MSKWKERIRKVIDKERERTEEKFREAQANYRDTGYQRYYTQMEKFEDELAELDDFLNSARNVAVAESEARRYRKAIFAYMDKMESYVLDHKGVERPIEETVKEMEARLRLALEEAGARRYRRWSMSDDLISRQVAIKAICEDGTWLERQGCTDISMAERKQRDVDILSDLPSAEPERGQEALKTAEEFKQEALQAIKDLGGFPYKPDIYWSYRAVKDIPVCKDGGITNVHY